MEENDIVIIVGGDYWGDIKKIIEKPGSAKKEHKDAVYVKSLKQLSSILSSKRMTIFQYLSQHREQTIGEIAQKLDRKQEAVSRDIHLLKNYGLVKLRKRGTKVYPKATGKRLVVSFG